MQFIHQPLTWGFLLVLLPLLIHLINMMRHKRIEWAAMDFLLASYKKHRRWVWLKQLLLLLLRMIGIAAVVAMLAKLVTQDEWSQLFGGQVTHHYLLLDDSLSMADQSGDGSAFTRAQSAIAELVDVMQRDGRQQKLTLLRFSRAAAAARNGISLTDQTGPEVPPDDSADKTSDATSEEQPLVADFNAALISEATARQVSESTQAFRVSQLATGPVPSLKLVEQLIRESSSEQGVVHLVSDFRDTDWNQPAEIKEQLKRIAAEGTRINLVRCAERTERNLAIVSLEPEIGTRAAGVPFIVEFAVHNYSDETVTQLRVSAKSTFHPTAPNGVESSPQTTPLPDVVIDRIRPKETIRRQFQVYFPTPGEHHVSVQLPMDAVAADNQRWCVVRLQSGESALIVDGSPGESGAYYLESIFRPGSNAKTGIIPNTQPLNFLRDADAEELDRYHAIYLVDVPPLDARSLGNLEEYVRRGGGVGLFLGENHNSAFYENWYNSGFFPLPVQGKADHVQQSGKADVVFNDHPLFAALTGQRNPFAQAIRISNYVTVPKNWKPPSDSNITVLATLADGSPLVAQRTVGDGRVVAFMTPIKPGWNNWALEPSFIVVALQLHGHLAQPKRPSQSRRVGEPLTLQIDAAEYMPELDVVAPDLNAAPSRIFSSQASPPDADSSLSTISLGTGAAFVRGTGETDTAGIYDLQLQTVDSLPHHRRFAFNVDPIEGDLSYATSRELVDSLDPIEVQVVDASQANRLGDDEDNNSWSQFLLGLLIVILIAEQFLAYRLSYHPQTAQPVGGTS